MKYKRWTGLLPLLWVVGTSHAVDLAATVTHETREITADGMTRTTTYADTFVRAGQQVWTERVLPVGTPKASHDEGHDHDDTLANAAFWLARAPGGALTVRFVRADEKDVVTAREGDYSAVGFSGSWEESWYLVPPAVLAQMTIIERTADTTVYERRSNGRHERVVWSTRLEIPLLIETGSERGSSTSRITIVPAELPARLPWAGLGDFRQKDYMDLLD